jgi:hypothetical protein
MADGSGSGIELAIEKHIATRRAILPEHERPAPGSRPWGLALSGGGVRSATFCFGLLKALANQGLLHRFDLLSTVSGGGYIGATVGKLFQNQVPAQTSRDPHPSTSPAPESNAPASRLGPLDVESVLGDADRHPFAMWLRANGRYLIPRGTKDIIFAGANFGRNLLGIHIELAFLALLLGGFLVGLDLLVWQWADCVFRGRECWGPDWIRKEHIASISGWPTPWLLEPAAAWCGGVLACAYWATPTRSNQGIGWLRWVSLVIATAGILILLNHSAGGEEPASPDQNLRLPVSLVIAALALLTAWLGGTLLAFVLSASSKPPEWTRNRLTGALSSVLRFGLVIAGLGVVDQAAWALGNMDGMKQGGFGAAVALVAVALRAALPKIADLPKSLTPGTKRVVLGILNLAGLLLLVAVVLVWVSLVHWATSSALFADDAVALGFKPAWQWLAWIVTAPLLLVLASMANREFLNRSSLYTFYRARLVRSYLGAANPERTKALDDPDSGAQGPRDPSNVTDVDPADDIPMSSYAPHLAGGPVHLINVCVNQTRNPKGGLFNQDRKGLLMTIGPNGQVSTEKNVWHRPSPDASLTLGSWTAISGAAVAPGLGASTRSGLSAILMISGIRLGYWWDSLSLGRRKTVGKYGQLLSELRGRFDGKERRDWFLSDGGHFENTAAYALLMEECELIVVADCGADPRYSFGDLENLVRKARIDLQADITFLRPKGPDPKLPKVLGSLNELASADSEACLAIARINYRHTGQVGHLVIVKPNMCHGVPVDLVNFKADNPLFPQEPTTDQFFSEAQWESYFQLGQTLGGNIDPGLLANALEFEREFFQDDDGAILVKDAAGKQTLQFPSKRLSSRVGSTGAVSASISFGAISTLGLAAWQAVSTEVAFKSQAARIEPAAYKELTDHFGKLSPAAGAASSADVSRLGEMATSLLRIGNSACTAYNVADFRDSLLMGLMIEKTRSLCDKSSPQHFSCERLLVDDGLAPCIQQQPRPSCVAMYWTRDYAAKKPRFINCWPTPKASSTDAPPGVTPSASPASAAGASADKMNCKGITVNVQIFGPELQDCRRRSKSEPPRRPKIEPGVEADFELVGCG